MAPIPQISKALEISENVQKSQEDLWANKSQCKRVADRFQAIGNGLKKCVETSAGINCHDSTVGFPAFEELLTVLQKGQALVPKYVKKAGIEDRVLTWSDNREAFKEIHEELETMKATFPFDGFGDEFETASWSQKYEILTQDADEDAKQAMSSMRDQSLSPEKERVALEKAALEPTESPLPSYLHIDFAKIKIKDPVREQKILSKPALDDGWAIVCEASWLDCDFAVKVFKSKQVEWNKDQMVKEVLALMELRHPHIVPFVGFAQDIDTDTCAVLMEMMPERDLREYIKKHLEKFKEVRPRPRPFTRSQELDIITQIAKGMLYLHTREYVHGDLKCSNILVKKHGDYIEVKIGDLRYAEKLQSGGGNSVRRARWTPLEALENYGGARPTGDLLKQADVYSFAMTCYEIVTGNLPFQDIQGDALIKMIEEGKRPELPEDLEQSGLKGLIEACWSDDPNRRPTFELICVRLDTIRSSMPAVTDFLRTASNQISNLQKFLNPFCCIQEAQSISWNEIKGLRESGGSAPACPIISYEALSILEEVGKGAFATVYEAKWLGSTFAVKRFKDARAIPEEELKFLIRLRHPYIIQLVGLSKDREGRYLIVMEYVRGSLRNLIDSRRQAKKSTGSSYVRPFEPAEEVSIITKLAHGMAFLHSRGVAHRDLKAKNVLCQEYPGYFDVKIVDFGASQMIAEGDGGLVGVGTGYWRAPETFPSPADKPRECGFTNLMAADVYSFAMTCYEIVTGLIPFELEFGDVLTRYNEVKGDGGRRPELPEDLNAGLKVLIEECWRAKPALRPDFAQICTRLNALLACEVFPS